MTAATLAKAERLLDDQRVSSPIGGLVFQVQGDHDTYVVTLAEDVQICTCPTHGECSHVRACVNWVLKDRS